MGIGADQIATVVDQEVDAFAALYDAASSDFRDLETKANQVADRDARGLTARSAPRFLHAEHEHR